MVIVFPHYKYILSYHKLQAKAKKQKLPFGPLRVLNLTEPAYTIIVHPEHRPTFTLPYYNARALRSMNLQQFWEYVILPHHSIAHSLFCALVLFLPILYVFYGFGAQPITYEQTNHILQF